MADGARCLERGSKRQVTNDAVYLIFGGETMPDCESLSTCLFFNEKMANMPAMTTYLKAMYCRSDNTKCARYMVFKALGKGKVSADLYPDEVDRAVRTISGS